MAADCVTLAAVAAATAAALRWTCVWLRCRTAVFRNKGSSRLTAPPHSIPTLLVKLLAMLLLKRARCVPEEEAEESMSCEKTGKQVPSLLCLPDLALENILGRLNASSLPQTSRVCRELRIRCKSDHLWERLVSEKWGNLAGPDSFRKHRKSNSLAAVEVPVPRGLQREQRNLWHILWPLSWFSFARECYRKKMITTPLVLDSLMAWYFALESGSFWFPAQVYNRECGHVGFVLSCYDAELSYDRSSDSFRARYPPHGTRAVQEEFISWERLRPISTGTSAHGLHAFDCLAELKPGDHVEVQWRRNRAFPYGWWYGVVGHAESCTNDIHCNCRFENTIWLVFKQYTLGSRWRRAAINRQRHREDGNEGDGFYGGIRKLRSKDEISTWERLWPAETLE